MDKIKKIIIAVLVAAILFGILVMQINKMTADEVEYVDVVYTTREIEGNSKIGKNDVTIKSIPKGIIVNAVVSESEVINKYTKETLYPGEPILYENIKAETSTETLPETRKVRVLTNIASFGGVGKGDKVDLIYIGKINSALNTVGKLMKEGIEVKSVLNRAGKDLESVMKDEYNEADLEPVFIEFEMDQDLALEIEVLQGNANDVVFKMLRWVDKSAETGNKELKDPYRVIYGKTEDELLQEGVEEEGTEDEGIVVVEGGEE